ncbi:MAG: YicC family protein, partial [Bullifex sp.]
MKSMTGYGYGAVSREDLFLEVEIKSYNNRYLDIYHNIHSALSSFEAEIDEEIKKVASRGKIEITVRLKQLVNNGEIVVDTSLLDKYDEAFKIISDHVGHEVSLSAGDCLNAEGLISYVSEKDPEVYREPLVQALSKALGQFEEAKLREGAATGKDLERLGRDFEAANARIGELADGFEGYFDELLMSKYRQLAISDRIDENQFRQEVGALLVKYSINEEQSRLKTHIAEYFRLLSSGEPVGKRLDFLCQEMNRETNTT